MKLHDVWIEWTGQMNSYNTVNRDTYGKTTVMNNYESPAAAVWAIENDSQYRGFNFRMDLSVM